MELDFIYLAIGIAFAGYCIGNGLKNFRNPQAKGLLEYLGDDDQELIKQDHVYEFMGISKEDAKTLFEDHRDIPHIIINGTVYYPRTKLREWLLHIGE